MKSNADPHALSDRPAKGQRHDIEISNVRIRFKGTVDDAENVLAQLKDILHASVLEATVRDLTVDKEFGHDHVPHGLVKESDLA